MPAIHPGGGQVTWPADEGAIGVVGVAPWATLDFCRAVYSLVDATKDWHYPRILVDANSKIPSRGRHLELGEEDPSPYIRQTIGELASQGAAVVAVPCNTAHILFNRWAGRAHVPVPSAIDAVVDRVFQLGARKAIVLSSRLIAAHGVYTQALATKGIHLVDTDETLQGQINALISLVKTKGGAGTEQQARIGELFERASESGANFIVLGCTELSAVAVSAPALPGMVIVDSNQELARACLSRIGIHSEKDSFNRGLT
jgi:aspartate racemase